MLRVEDVKDVDGELYGITELVADLEIHQAAASERIELSSMSGRGPKYRQRTLPKIFRTLSTVAPPETTVLTAPGTKSPAGSASVKRARATLMSAAIFMARIAHAVGFERLACFEIAPDWLWEGHSGEQATTIMAVVNEQGRILQSGRPLPADTAQMFARSLSNSVAHGGTGRRLTWQEGGNAWRGSLAQVPLAHERITAMPWAVVAFDREPPSWRAAPASGSCCRSALFAARDLGAGRLASCASLPAGASSAQAQSSRTARAHIRQGVRRRRGGRAGRLIDAFNRCAWRLEEQFHALETLGEIDKLLLGSAELEQVLDAILSRVQSVTRCHSVGITLCDADAPGHAPHVSRGDRSRRPAGQPRRAR